MAGLSTGLVAVVIDDDSIAAHTLDTNQALVIEESSGSGSLLEAALASRSQLRVQCSIPIQIIQQPNQPLDSCIAASLVPSMDALDNAVVILDSISKAFSHQTTGQTVASLVPDAPAPDKGKKGSKKGVKGASATVEAVGPPRGELLCCSSPKSSNSTAPVVSVGLHEAGSTVHQGSVKLDVVAYLQKVRGYGQGQG